jgi:hypothetical protein
MCQPSVPDLIDLLQATLEHLKRNQNLSSDDPALLELKQTIVRALAELELVSPRKTEAA